LKIKVSGVQMIQSEKRTNKEKECFGNLFSPLLVLQPVQSVVVVVVLSETERDQDKEREDREVERNPKSSLVTVRMCAVH
jgi:hypothetical protein